MTKTIHSEEKHTHGWIINFIAASIWKREDKQCRCNQKMSWPIRTHPSTQMWILACICRHKLLYCTFMYACMHLWACSNPHTHIYTLWKSITISTPLTFSLNINILYRQTSLSSGETALTARTTFAYQRKFVQTHVNKNQILRPLPHHCTADTLHEEEQIFTCQEIQTGILLPTFTFLPTSGTWECISHEDFLNIW